MRRRNEAAFGADLTNLEADEAKEARASCANASSDPDAERLSRRAEPSDADVRRAAERYRQWYGERALSVIGNHMLGGRFAPEGRHSRFLKRVVGQFQAGARGRR